jgi:DNA-binding transcriptional LysR family regulator
MKSMRQTHASAAPSFPRQLPPLHALEVFVTAARCGSFSQAARDLDVTQSAVSRQIQQIEQHLGLALFVRHKTGLRLTPEGEALLPVVNEAFGRVAGLCENLRSSAHILTLRMPPTLATRWFLPLLPDLQQVMPGVDVRITTYDSREPRFEDSGVDAAILHGGGDWPGLEVMKLMPERLTPVCSPALASQINAVSDLARVPLLQCDPVHAWTDWLRAVGGPFIAPPGGQTFDTLELALSAATRGQGVAMGDLTLIHESLADGTLVAPFANVLDQGRGYFLVYPPPRAQRPKIRALRDWLTARAFTSSRVFR